MSVLWERSWISRNQQSMVLALQRKNPIFKTAKVSTSTTAGNFCQPHPYINPVNLQIVLRGAFIYRVFLSWMNVVTIRTTSNRSSASFYQIAFHTMTMYLKGSWKRQIFFGPLSELFPYSLHCVGHYSGNDATTQLHTVSMLVSGCVRGTSGA